MVAAASGDTASAIAAMENRVLATAAQGDLTEAFRIATNAKNRAKRAKLWDWHTSSLTLAADIEWQRQHFKSASRLYLTALREANKRKQAARLPSILVNCARLQQLLGNASEAIRLLRRRFHSEAGHRNDHVAQFILAEAYLTLKDLARAEKYFLESRSTSEKLKDSNYVALCSSRLGEIRESMNDLSRSEDDIIIAIRNERDPKGTALLMAQLLRVQIRSGNSRKIQKTFEKCRDLAVEGKLPLVYIDTHVMIARYEWTRSKGVRLNAFKAYACAMLKAIEVGPEIYADLFTGLFRLMATGNAMQSHATLLWLTEHFSAWAAKEISSDPRVLRFVVWPFETITRVWPLLSKPGVLAKELRLALEANSPFAASAPQPCITKSP